jgi:predicted metalloprotease with PDZ domain
MLMLNFDMIGRNPETPIEIIGDGFSMGMAEVIRTANQSVELNMELAGDGYFGASDHDPFFKLDRPFLFFFTGTHEDYHQLTDHVDKLDLDQMYKITQLGSNILEPVVNNEYTPHFISHLSWMGIALSTHTSTANILNVIEDSRAQEVKLQANDTIVGFNAEELSPTEISTVLKNLDPGTSVQLQIQRGEEKFDVEIMRAKTGYVGIYPAQVPSEMRKTLAIPETEGVLIRQVTDDGPASKSGLQVDDIILQISGRSVTPRTLGAILQRIGAGEKVVCLVLRDGERIKVELILGERPER